MQNRQEAGSARPGSFYDDTALTGLVDTMDTDREDAA